MWSQILDILTCIFSLIVYGGLTIIGICGVYFGIKEAVKNAIIEALKDAEFKTTVKVRKEKQTNNKVIMEFNNK